MTRYLPPPPPEEPGSFVPLAAEVRGRLDRGRLGNCCICSAPCLTWWSPRRPQRYVPVHAERCAAHLVEHWIKVITSGEQEQQAEPLVPAGRRGAYARRPATAVPSAATAPVGIGAVLPEGFTPGPFWLPGDDHRSPWTVLLETGAGQTICPAGPNEAHGRAALSYYRARKLLDRGQVPVAGGVLIAPGGERFGEWGCSPEPGSPRWESIATLSMWQRCTDCGDLRWPGSWMTVVGYRCAGCQRGYDPEPRPWPPDPQHPGEAAIPEMFTKVKKVTLPPEARLVPTLRRSRTG